MPHNLCVEAVTIVRDTPRKQLEESDLFQYVLSIQPGCAEAFPENAEANVVMLLTNAHFDPNGPINHWLPGVRRSVLGEELWASLVNLEDCRAGEEEARLAVAAKEQLDEVKAMRNDFSAVWRILRRQAPWQELFALFLMEDHEDPVESLPTPPPKKDMPEKETPPKEVEEGGKRKPAMFGGCQTAPAFRRTKVKVTLESRPVPYEKAAQIEEHELPDLVEVKEEPQDVAQVVPTAGKRRRECKRRHVCNRRALRTYLAEKGITYARWMARHWQNVSSKKAGTCQDGTYRTLQVNILDESGGSAKVRSCEVCQTFLDEMGFSFEGLAAALNPGEGPPVPLQDDGVKVSDHPEEVQQPDMVESGDEGEILCLSSLARSICAYLEARLGILFYYLYGIWGSIYLHNSTYI